MAGETGSPLGTEDWRRGLGSRRSRHTGPKEESAWRWTPHPYPGSDGSDDLYRHPDDDPLAALPFAEDHQGGALAVEVGEHQLGDLTSTQRQAEQHSHQGGHARWRLGYGRRCLGSPGPL